MYACLAVTCHLHFWQNDRDFLRATVVTRGWNGYRNKSQHRKSTLEKKILPPFQQGFEPATFQSRVRRSNHWAIPARMQWTPVIYVFEKRDPSPMKTEHNWSASASSAPAPPHSPPPPPPLPTHPPHSPTPKFHLPCPISSYRRLLNFYWLHFLTLWSASFLCF